MARCLVKITNSRRPRLPLRSKITGKHPAPILHAVQCLGLAVNEIPNPLQVYIVEDSTIIRRLLVSTIEAAGAELAGSSTGAQSAIADLAVLPPDLILIDIR